MDKKLDYLQGFNNFSSMDSEIKLSVEGTLPEWLNGVYLRNGSGLFDFPQQSVKHWFDGLSLINKFVFQTGKPEILYQSRLLPTTELKTVQITGKLGTSQFGTQPSKDLLQRLINLFKPLHSSDNTAVNILPLSDIAIALTETPVINQVDVDTLTKLTPLKFPDKLTYQISTAHPVYDVARKKLLNLAVSMGIKSFYTLFEMDLITFKRTLICQIPVKNPAYHHSFFATADYIILVECPYQVSPTSLFFAMKGFGPAYIENYHWQPKKNTCFIIIDRNTRTVIKKIEHDALFTFHTANAYQQGSEIILDLIAYENPEVIQQLYLKNIVQGHPLKSTRLVRFTANLAKNTLEKQELAQLNCEFPRFNYQKFASNYRYLYTAGWEEDTCFITDLLKWDLQQSTQKIWREDNCYPGEPLFIAKPKAIEEDDGVVISIVLQAVDEYSFLLVLNAQTWEEQARIRLPHVLPFGLHGNFKFTPSNDVTD